MNTIAVVSVKQIAAVVRNKICEAYIPIVSGIPYRPMSSLLDLKLLQELIVFDRDEYAQDPL